MIRVPRSSYYTLECLSCTHLLYRNGPWYRSGVRSARLPSDTTIVRERPLCCLHQLIRHACEPRGKSRPASIISLTTIQPLIYSAALEIALHVSRMRLPASSESSYVSQSLSYGRSRAFLGFKCSLHCHIDTDKSWCSGGVIRIRSRAPTQGD